MNPYRKGERWGLLTRNRNCSLSIKSEILSPMRSAEFHCLTGNFERRLKTPWRRSRQSASMGTRLSSFFLDYGIWLLLSWTASHDRQL